MQMNNNNSNGMANDYQNNNAGNNMTTVAMMQQQQQFLHHQQQQQLQPSTSESQFGTGVGSSSWMTNNALTTQQQLQQQQQYQNAQLSQMIYRGQQQTPTNASMNGYPPCTSASPSGAPASAGPKKSALKRKNGPAQTAGPTMQITGAQGDAAAKKPAFGNVNAQMAQRQAPVYHQFAMQQQPSSNLSAAITPPQLMSQPKFGQYAGYESPNGNFVNNTSPQQQQQQTWSDGTVKRPNSSSEMVRLELRNSVHARQNAAAASPPNPVLVSMPRTPSVHDAQGQIVMMNNQRIHQQQQQSQQQQQMMTANFISPNQSNNNMLSYNDKLMSPTFYSPGQQYAPMAANASAPPSHDCRNNLLSLIDLVPDVDVFDFNLLNGHCGFDMDNIETQKLVQKLLS